MKKLITLTSILIFLVIKLSGQEKLVIGTSPRIGYIPVKDDINLREGVDSTVFIKDKRPDWQCGEVEVYYDLSMKNIAYKSYNISDSCFVKQYWRNGKIKEFEISVLKTREPSNLKYLDWVYSEYYCINGQLIYKGPSPNILEKYHYVQYYCNGQKRSEFDRDGGMCVGKMTWWYENGKLKREAYFENHKRANEWKYWNPNGKLVKIEIYNNGVVQTIKNY